MFREPLAYRNGRHPGGTLKSLLGWLAFWSIQRVGSVPRIGQARGVHDVGQRFSAVVKFCPSDEPHDLSGCGGPRDGLEESNGVEGLVGRTAERRAVASGRPRSCRRSTPAARGRGDPGGGNFRPSSSRVWSVTRSRPSLTEVIQLEESGRARRPRWPAWRGCRPPGGSRRP